MPNSFVKGLLEVRVKLSDATPAVAEVTRGNGITNSDRDRACKEQKPFCDAAC